MEFKVKIKCKCLCEYEIKPANFDDNWQIRCPNCGFRIPDKIEAPLKAGLISLAKVPSSVDLDDNGVTGFGDSLHFTVVVPDNDWGVFM